MSQLCCRTGTQTCICVAPPRGRRSNLSSRTARKDVFVPCNSSSSEVVRSVRRSRTQPLMRSHEPEAVAERCSRRGLPHGLLRNGAAEGGDVAHGCRSRCQARWWLPERGGTPLLQAEIFLAAEEMWWLHKSSLRLGRSFECCISDRAALLYEEHRLVLLPVRQSYGESAHTHNSPGTCRTVMGCRM